MQLKTLSLALIASCALGSSSAFAAAISFNSRGGTGTAMLATDTAGAPGANFGNWNDMNSSTSGAGQPITGSIAAGSVVDSSGSPLATTTIAWSGVGVATASGGGTNDQKMWESEWDLFNTNNPGPIDMTITVTNVPYANYDVYFYVQSGGNSANRGGDVTANGVLKSITMVTADGFDYIEADSSFTWNVATTDVGRYLRLENVTGSNLSLVMDARNPSVSRLRMSGFQIVQIPEPSTALLGVFGGLLLLRRRRK